MHELKITFVLSNLLALTQCGEIGAVTARRHAIVDDIDAMDTMDTPSCKLASATARYLELATRVSNARGLNGIEKNAQVLLRSALHAWTPMPHSTCLGTTPAAHFPPPAFGFFARPPPALLVCLFVPCFICSWIFLFSSV